jgi:hypothetical protein
VALIRPITHILYIQFAAICTYNHLPYERY